VNATFRGQLNATRGSPHDDWVITSQEMKAFLAAAGEDVDDEADDSFAITPLTQSEEKELD